MCSVRIVSQHRKINIIGCGSVCSIYSSVGVKENAFLGKTVLFPAVKDVPLLTADRLSEVSPNAAAALEPGAVWTTAAEDILLSERLDLA